MRVLLENGDLLEIPAALNDKADVGKARAAWLAQECQARGVKNPDELAAAGRKADAEKAKQAQAAAAAKAADTRAATTQAPAPAAAKEHET